MPESIIASKTEPVFVAKSHNLRINRFPEQSETYQGGAQRQITPGMTYEFENATFRVDDDLRKREAAYVERYGDKHTPDTVDGDFLSPEEWLRQRSEKTRDFYEMPVPIPDSGPMLQEIATAILSEDEERIATIYADEQENHERQDVLDTARESLEKLEQNREAREGSERQAATAATAAAAGGGGSS